MADHIAALRARIAELQAEHARVAVAPPPERDAMAAIEAQVAGLAAGLPPLTAGNLDALLRARPAAVLARLAPEAVMRAIADDMHAGYAANGARPMTAAARAKELARIDAALFAAEVEEEQLIRAAEACGEQADRRADARPDIVLMEEIAA